MSATVAQQPPPPEAPEPTRRRSAGDIVRFVLRGIGQTLITAGLVVLLFVVYEVYITNIFAAEKQAAVRNNFQQELKDGGGSLLKLPGSKDPTIKLGAGIANIYIPRLGQDYHFTIVQGSATPTQAQLEEGPAHYRDSQLPGQIGNFAVAGHRVGKGEPFLNLDKLRPNDAVIIETKNDWYVYRVKGTQHGLTKDDADGLPGRQVVSPSDADPLLPVPDHPHLTRAQATERLMTMTTCTPKFTAAQRMIVYAQLDQSASVPVTAQRGEAVLAMPAAIKALYSEVSS